MLSRILNRLFDSKNNNGAGLMFNQIKKYFLILTFVGSLFPSFLSADGVIQGNIWNDINTADTNMRTVIKRLKDKISKKDFISSHKGHGYTIDTE